MAVLASISAAGEGVITSARAPCRSSASRSSAPTSRRAAPRRATDLVGVRARLGSVGAKAAPLRPAARSGGQRSFSRRCRTGRRPSSRSTGGRRARSPGWRRSPRSSRTAGVAGLGGALAPVLLVHVEAEHPDLAEVAEALVRNPALLLDPARVVVLGAVLANRLFSSRIRPCSSASARATERPAPRGSRPGTAISRRTRPPDPSRTPASWGSLPGPPSEISPYSCSGVSQRDKEAPTTRQARPQGAASVSAWLGASCLPSRTKGGLPVEEQAWTSARGFGRRLGGHPSALDEPLRRRSRRCCLCATT